MEDEEFLPRMEVEELLRRYAAGERRFIRVDLSGADLSGLDFGRKGRKGIVYKSIGTLVKKSNPVKPSISSIVTRQLCQFLHSALLLIIFIVWSPDT
jgi:hypothetical protein